MSSGYWSRRYARRTALRGAGTAGVGAAALGLVGCGDDDKPQATSTAAPGGSSPGASASASAAPTKVDLTKLSDDDFFKAIPSNPPKDWQDKDIKTGGRMVWLTKSLGPQNPWTASDQTRWHVQSVYSTLLRSKNQQGIKSPQLRDVEGDLAAKWEIPDPQTVVVTLAPNIKFHNVAPVNGRAMTADDIKYSLDQARNYTKATLAKAHNALFQSVEDIGNNQIRIKLTRPEPLVESYLALQRAISVVPKEIGDNPDLLEQKPIGTGGFIQKSYTPNVEIVFDKNPDYFKTDAQGRKLPYMDGWRAPFYRDDASGLNSFLTEQADWSQAGLLGANPYEAIRDVVKQAPGVAMSMVPPGWGYQGISGKREVPDSPWNDIRVRRAMNMLVPREALTRTIFKNLAGTWPHFPWGYLFDTPPQVKDLGQWYQFNPKEAKALLDAAGLKDPTFELEYYDAPGLIAQQLVVYQEEAAKVGVKLNLSKQQDYVTILTRMGSRAFKDLSFHHHNTPLFIDPTGTMIDYVAGQPEDQGFSRVDDSVMNDLFKKIQVTPPGNDRKALGKQVWDRQLDQVYEIQLLVPISPAVQHPRLKNWVNTAWASTYNSITNFDQMWIDPTAKLKG